jgi:uncharacterized protein YbjT (DUF2867 family)
MSAPRIAIIGGHGFIGRHIAAALRAAGCVPFIVTRNNADLDLDLLAPQASSPDSWRTHIGVARINAVINCAGILHGSDDAFDAIHRRVPAALATACRKAEVPFMHIGILGFYGSPKTAYFLSKHRGEEAIRIANPAAIIVRPSLVFGEDGPATRALLLQSALPLLVLPAPTGKLAPIHVDDLAELCAVAIQSVRAHGHDIDAVGDETTSMAAYLACLRQHRLANPRAARVLTVPIGLVELLARIAGWLGSRTLCKETIDLMRHDHIGKPGAFQRWLRRPPRPMAQFV